MYVLSHESAFEYLRSLRSKGQCALDVQRVKHPESGKTRLFIALSRISLSYPVSILVPPTHRRANLSSVNFRTMKNLEHYPVFEYCGEDFSIPIAPLILCQVAKKLSLPKLTLRILELCGTYTYGNIDDSVRYQIPAITSYSEISAFLKWKKKIPIRIAGSAKVVRALKFAQDGSASPMESKIFAMLTLPKKVGGFALSNCVLNHKIELSAEGKRMTGSSNLYGDICMPKKKIVIEYDSRTFHSDSTKLEKDKIRRDCLALENWNIYTLTLSELRNFDLFMTKIHKILRNAKIYIYDEPPNYKELQKRLFFELRGE